MFALASVTRILVFQHTHVSSGYGTRPTRASHSSGDDKLGLNLWIRHIVDCEVRILRLEIHDLRFKFGMPLVSQHLKTLALIGVCLDSLCNFSNCPNLEHLEIAESYIYEAPQISSKSLKHLSISDCYFSYKGLHTLLFVPQTLFHLG